MKLRDRKVNIKLLAIDTVLYRIFVIMEQAVVYWIIGYITGLWGWKLSLGCSVIWNIINMVTYFGWHYYLFHWFKMGKNG